MTHFHVKDHEALAVLIRFADCCGNKITRVVPINDYFVVSVEGDLEVTSHTNLRPFAAGLDSERTFWSEILTVDESALTFIGL